MSLSPYSFRMASEFLARGNLEDMMTLFFFQDRVLISIWRTTWPIFVCLCPKDLLQIVTFLLFFSIDNKKSIQGLILHKIGMIAVNMRYVTAIDS